MFTNLSIALLANSALALISPLALLFGYLRYQTKAGMRIHGTYMTTVSISCPENYVSSVTLENQKDRAVAIFEIYLKIGHNYYILLDKFDKAPLILKAFETYQQNYDPIVFYSAGWQRHIEIGRLLNDRNMSKRLVLSTPQGKYIVPKHIRRWSPTTDFFNNFMTCPVYPARATYQGKAYGSAVIYLIEITFGKGDKKVIPIHSEEYNIFKDFLLTAESLESKNALDVFLKERQAEGKLVVNTVEVHDLKEWRAKVWDEKFDTITAKKVTWFQFAVLGRLNTWWERRRIHKLNKQNAILRSTLKIKELDKEINSKTF